MHCRGCGGTGKVCQGGSYIQETGGMCPFFFLETRWHLECMVYCICYISSVQVAFLTSVGGISLPHTTNRILRAALSCEVAAKYSWYGAKGKMKFGDLHLADMIIRTSVNNSNSRLSHTYSSLSFLFVSLLFD